MKKGFNNSYTGFHTLTKIPLKILGPLKIFNNFLHLSLSKAYYTLGRLRCKKTNTKYSKDCFQQNNESRRAFSRDFYIHLYFFENSLHWILYSLKTSLYVILFDLFFFFSLFGFRRSAARAREHTERRRSTHRTWGLTKLTRTGMGDIPKICQASRTMWPASLCHRHVIWEWGNGSLWKGMVIW
jgi:hypothetical protein